MREFFQQRPLLLLFGVAALGYLFGRVNWRGFSLGVAAVLFAGLLVGWLVPGADLPEFVPQLGLVLFVYTVGVASGPGFFASLRLRGVLENGLVLVVLLASGLGTVLLALALGLSGPTAAGVFSGALTNAPALAAVVEGLKAAGVSGPALSEPVLACSICYPLGVLLPLLVVAWSPRLFGVRYDTEQVSSGYGGNSGTPIVSATLAIGARPPGNAATLRHTADYAVNFGRIRRGTVTSVVHDETDFLPGDLVTVVGTEQNVENAIDALGRHARTHLEYDRSEVDFRRMFVSNADVTERPLKELQLIQRYDAVITRVRRGDVDLVPDAEFELILGDRVRVLAATANMPRLERLFGDSYRRLAEIDVITFGLGIALGLLLGAVKVPLPGHTTFSLGPAGGPLVMGLCLGRAGRTGPLVWTPPFGVNLTLRQFGLVLFLAGVGLKAGEQLAGPLSPASLLPVLAAGAAVSALAPMLALVVGHRLLRVPLSVLVGAVAGLHTQPAVLAYALEKTGKEAPNLGYTTVFPFAMIAKILLAQALTLVIR
jgi:putative transport protein